MCHACERSARNCSSLSNSRSKDTQSEIRINRLSTQGFGVGMCAYTYVRAPMRAHLCVPAQLRAGGSQSARKGFVGQEYFVLAMDCVIKRED